jgi:hypothetical protein
MQSPKQSNHWISNWFSDMMPVSPAIVGSLALSVENPRFADSFLKILS